MKPAYVVGALIAACFLVYGNTLSAQFIYDDNPVIVKNPLIRKLDQIPLLFGTSYWGMARGQPKEFKGALYRPLTMTTFALNYYVGRLYPRGYHWVNLLLHIGVTLLLWVLCLRLGWSPLAASTSALLFAVLPIHTEAVSNIVGRSEVLAAFFVLSSWILATEEPTWPPILIGAVCFGLALLSKENAAAFLPVLIVSDIVTSRDPWTDLWKKRLLVWIVYGGCLLLYLEWRYLIVGSLLNAGGIPYFISQNLLIRCLTMSKFFIQHYLAPLLTGIGLCAEYTRPAFPDARLQEPAAWYSVLFLAALFGTTSFSALKNRNAKTLGILIFFGLLLPVTNLAATLEVIGAERFLYLPSIGYCMGLGLLFGSLYRSKSPIATWATIIFTSLCLWYAGQTVQRNRAWQTQETFWKTTVQDAPQSPRSWNGLGIVLMNQKKYDQAIEAFNKALELNNMLLDADYNLATCFFLKGDYARAKRGYLYMSQFKPYDPDTLYHLAKLSEKEKDFKGAAGYYSTILRVIPGDLTAEENLAKMKGKL